MKSEVSTAGAEGSASEQEGKPSSSLIGKINNLVTTDLNNLLDAHHTVYMFTYIPLQLAVSLLFLYSILGWRYGSTFGVSTALFLISLSSAFVSFGVTLLLFPIPGLLANVTQKIQRERMKRTDERIQLVTESQFSVVQTSTFPKPIPKSSYQSHSDGQALWLGSQNERKDCRKESGRAEVDKETPLRAGYCEGCEVSKQLTDRSFRKLAYFSVAQLSNPGGHDDVVLLYFVRPRVFLSRSIQL